MPKPLDGELNDEAVHLTQRALYIEPLNYPFDKNKCPTNGHEYIHLVRQEHAAIHPEASKDDYLMVTDLSRDRPSNCSAKRDLKEWKKYQASQFSQIAIRLKSQRQRLMTEFPKGRLPPLADEEDCCIFCLGTDMYNRIYEDENVDNNKAGHLPYLSVVLHLSQEEILSLLRNLSGWSSVIGMNHTICMWIYALLAVLRKPVSRECERFLEELYDECLLKVKESDESQKVQLHLISTILGNYFCVKAYKLGTPMERFRIAR